MTTKTDKKTLTNNKKNKEEDRQKKVQEQNRDHYKNRTSIREQKDTQ